MRRRLLILAFIGLVLVLVASQFFPSDPTERDYSAITRVVRRWTTQPIAFIDPLASGGVCVGTHSEETLDSDSFRLRKVFGMWWVYSHQRHAYPVQKGIPGRPLDPTELAGRFVQSDFTTSIVLTLSSNGTYAAQWEADVGRAGEAAGSWSVQGTQVVLVPTRESGMMKPFPRSLDLHRFESNWVLVAPRDRQSYNKYGITMQPLFPFQKDNRQ